MTDNVLDIISQEIVSDARKETVQVEKDPSPDLYDYEGIQHMLVIYIHNWYGEENSTYAIDFIDIVLKRYLKCILPAICTRHNIIIMEPGQNITDENGKGVTLDTYLVLIPLRCSCTPYSFFVSIQMMMRIMNTSELHYHFDMYIRDPGGEFVDFGSYMKDNSHEKYSMTMNGIKQLLRTCTQSDLMESIKNVKSYELFRKMDTWGLFSARGYNADDIEMGFMRVLMRE